jgi:hypothetical protein
MAKGKWKAQRTLLIVGEGAHDVAFLKHAKSVFVTRGCGLAVQIKNANGRGALHVINYAISLSNNANYDAVAALFDTDEGWSEAVATLARRNDITTLKSDSCLETMLLRALKLDRTDNSTSLKKRLAKQLNGDARESTSYARCFTRDGLEKTKEPTLVALAELLSVKKK